MFINTVKFKKMLKTAYDSCGLLMSREGDVLLLEGGVFLIRIQISRMSKKEKAAIIEVAGKIPDDKETFRANKMGEQQELRIPEIWGFCMQFQQANKNYAETYVMVDTGATLVRAFQNKEDNSIFWLNDFMAGAVSPEARQDFETLPSGPRMTETMAMWQNDVCTYAVLKFDLKNEKLSSLLENMELYTCH